MTRRRAAVASAAASAGGAAALALARRARGRARAWTISGADAPIGIRRDEHGVPHVRAASASDALRGLGYCHGHDRPIQIVLGRLIGEGRAAQALEDSEELVAIDTLFRRLDLGRDADEQVALLAPACRALLEAYCAGVSEALARRRPWELVLLRHRPAPWRPRDAVVLARLMGYVGLAQSQGDMERILVEMVQGGASEALLAELLPGRLELLDAGLLRSVTLGTALLPAASRLGLPSLSASNAWAVAPQHTRDGAALLASDPHLEINRLPALWYEAVLDHGDRWCAGASMPGLPAVLIGRNADVAWGLTYGGGDAVDSWVEECRDGCFARDDDGGERRWTAFRRRVERVERRGGTPLELEVFENDHGVLDGDPRVAGRYLCTRWASAHGTGAASIAAMLELPRATGVDDAAGLVRDVEFSFNWILADRSGAVGHQMSGRIPRRPRGNGLLPLAGWSPGHDWDGFLSAGELPRRLRPSDGIAASANEDVNHLGAVPVITLPAASYRVERILELLRARSDWTVADFERMQSDRVSLQARRYFGVLRPLLARDPRFAAIAGWDGDYDGDARAAAWFEAFYAELAEHALVLACGDAGRFILRETAMMSLHFGLLDDVLLRADSAWHGPGGRDVAFRRAADRAFATAPATLAERGPLVMGHLLFHGTIPSWAGFDRRPGELRGSRATIHQGQRVRSGGRDICVGPSYRMVTDLAQPMLRTALPGGPSDRRLSPWYASGVSGWWSGRSKTLTR